MTAPCALHMQAFTAAFAEFCFVQCDGGAALMALSSPLLQELEGFAHMQQCVIVVMRTHLPVDVAEALTAGAQYLL